MLDTHQKYGEKTPPKSGVILIGLAKSGNRESDKFWWGPLNKVKNPPNHKDVLSNPQKSIKQVLPKRGK